MSANGKYREEKNKDLFEDESTIETLKKLGNPLEIITELIDFELFRPILTQSLTKEDRKSNDGRPPIDPVLMFKILFLQRYYCLGDQQIQYQIVDRTSFRQFLGIKNVADVPDEKTVWKYKEALVQAGSYDKLFVVFIDFLKDKGLTFNEGKIIDASFVLVPRQRNTHEENEKIKKGEGKDLWNNQPNKKSHKDIEARWTKKGNESYYGYKNHSKVDVKTKMLMSYEVTSANVNDSKVIYQLVEKDDVGQTFWFDSGYSKGKGLRKLNKNNMHYQICKRGCRYKHLTERQIKNNRKKSKIRCRVEHVFGFMEQSMKGLFFRGVGITRAKSNIALTNLIYNMFRYTQIYKYQPQLLG